VLLKVADLTRVVDAGRETRAHARASLRGRRAARTSPVIPSYGLILWMAPRVLLFVAHGLSGGECFLIWSAPMAAGTAKTRSSETAIWISKARSPDDLDSRFE
jgi:hypothetical protein